MKTKRAASCVAVLAVVMLTQSVFAQRPGRRPGVRPAASPDKKSTEQAEKKSSEEPVTAIVGADIYTVSRGVIRKGVILVQGGKILKVGQDIKPPEDATVIDASGKFVTPGFVAMNMSRIGLRTSRSSRNAKTEDGLDPFDQNIKLALGVGITSGCLQISTSSRGGRRRNERFLGLDPDAEEVPPTFNPDFGDPDTSVCQCCGLPILPTEPIVPAQPTSTPQQKHIVLKMSYGDLDGMLASSTPVYGLSSGSLAGKLNRFKLRETVAKARKYLEEQEAHEKQVKAGKKSTPPKKPVTDDVLRLVKREIYLRTDANSVDQIRDMIALAKELDIKLMLDQAAEAWLVASELGEAKTPVAFTPRRYRAAPKGEEGQAGTSIEMSGTLEKAGVPFAVTSLSSSISLNGLAGRDLTSLPLEAAFAVRGGCSERAALASLTLVPAQMLGLADRIGSIDPGKDADLLILDGPPLDYRTYVDTAVVNGKVVYEREKDRIYPVFER